MKKTTLFVTLCFLTGAAFAQPGTKPVTPKPVAKPVPPLLKNMNDSASYAVGVSVANFYKQQGIKKLNTTLVSKAINDIMSGKTPLMDDAAANTTMNNYMTLIQTEKSKPRMDSGTAFMKQNKTKPGVKTTASGLQYEVITEGTGIKPTGSDSVTCNYMGTLINGFEFDNSYKRGEPITFNLGGVIKGWTEGLQLMSEGAKYKFYIPYALGY
ncbi:MAG TPA: FKBP-type peptidyl-prolyl cis-trans isomerase N-terminal domain-containing protein, partial [Chitinophagaceae bacterium]|nr:FKBP-type peptidyl-prolyl cis-trans isomerase N-terminal domain-containing protein [Chitinophagaceae bacterium]